MWFQRYRRSRRAAPSPRLFAAGFALTTCCVGVLRAQSGSPWGVSPSWELCADPASWAPQMADAGVTSVRGFDVGRDVSGLAPFRTSQLTVSGILQWSPASPATLPSADLAGFRRYVIEQVTRYKGIVRHWEVWNEPPNFTVDQSAASYAKVVAEAYDAAKSVDPSVQIGLCAKSVHIQYLAESMDAGARDKFDFISLHPYETAGLVPQGWEAPFLGITANVRAMLRERDPARQNVPVWFSEIGIEVTDRVTEKVQADTLVKLYTMGIAQGAAHVHWFDPRDSEGKIHGLLRADGSPRPAHRALASLTGALGAEPEYRGFFAPAADAYGFLFRRADAHVLVAWSRPGVRKTLQLRGTVAVVDPQTGSERNTQRVTLTQAPLLLSAPANSTLAAQWLRNADASRTSAWGEARSGATVAMIAGKPPGRLRMIDAPASQRVDGRDEIDLTGTTGARFAVDPVFFGYETRPLRVTLVVRGHGHGKPGFNLKYEARAPIAQSNDHGMVGTGTWNSLQGKRPMTLTWTIPDASFVGKYGANIAIDCDGPQFSDFSVISLSITKL